MDTQNACYFTDRQDDSILDCIGSLRSEVAELRPVLFWSVQ